MEAESVEDKGDGILFNVFCYNVQPGISIDYATGNSSDSGTQESSSENSKVEYILNTNSKKFHKPSCSSASSIKTENKEIYTGSRDDLIAQGYDPCKKCNP